MKRDKTRVDDKKNVKKVSGKSIGVSSSTYNFLTGTIVDSGTTLLVLPHKAFVAMNSTFHSLCKTTNLVGICDGYPGFFDGACVSLTAAQFAAYPPISFTFGQSSKITVSIPASAYLQQGFCLKKTSYALAIADGGLLLGTILGDTFMRNFETLFDRAVRLPSFFSSICFLLHSR